MPLIPPKPIPLQPERGGIQNLTADMDKLVAPEERTVPQVQTPDLSVKAQKRGGDYGVVAGAQDAVGGLGGDGIYGKLSVGRCKELQREAGLVPDGLVGPQTWYATFKLPKRGN